MENYAAIYAKALAGKRLTFEDALSLYQSSDLLALAKLARKAKEAKSGRNVYFNVNRHINLTNICVSRCPLCAFGRSSGDNGAYVFEVSDVARMVAETMQEVPDVTEFHMVSALHPEKDFQYYVDVVRTVKKFAPSVHLKAFTPVEIVHFCKISGLSIGSVLEKLKGAGLDSLPGGGAEILDDAVRRQICPNKATTAQWIDVIKTAHKLGIPTNATMLYGHIETIEQRIRHLITLRDIQDETKGFQAFVSFPFHPQNTGLTGVLPVSTWENLKMIALARVVLDNFDHIKAFWMMLTLPVAQLALSFGADDLDGTVVEEKIIHAAGAKTAKGISRQDIVKIILETGYLPIERDTFYQPIKIYEKDLK
ncbi:MAG: aminofutalosine synthase MqnE [Pelosinus sp.]|nr:aminofutalosine synthase MqnE [Pelosinus sp.]